MKKPELLAPVGSWEALIAAIQNGADAVYIGGKQFNARQYANNFDQDELRKAVDYAHIRGAKVFITVNTLVADRELEELVDYLRFLYEIGVDAIIVQDLGVARLAREVIPELTLHASTQMTLHNRQGIEAIRDLGFKRVVLAREMSAGEIADIKKTGMEVEVFVHGALCISYSGQCLMSSMIGGRSGNRGRCAQPCRLAYTLVDEKGRTLLEPDKVGKYLLSPRDLRLLHHIPELTEVGVDAFKIEGRMKRPEYVATVTRIYRQALDRYFAAPYNYEVSPEEAKQLFQIFNRDFSTGYFDKNLGADMMSYKRPNNRGIKIGRIAAYDWRKGVAQIQLEEKLVVGDGIEVWVTEGGRLGVKVHQIAIQGQPQDEAFPGQVVEIPLKGKVRVGDRVFKTNDVALMREAQQTFTSPKEIRKVKIAVKVRGTVGRPLEITAEDSEGNRAIAKTDFIGEEALNRPLTKETVRRQVERLGNTPFELGTLDIKIDHNIMVPLSEINDARRKALQLLEQQRAMLKKPAPIPEIIILDRLHKATQDISIAAIAHINEQDTPAMTELASVDGGNSLAGLKLSAAVSSKEAASAAIESGADIVYLGAESFNYVGKVQPDDFEELIEVATRQGVSLFFSTPRITKDKDLKVLESYIDKAANLDLGILAGNLGAFEFARSKGFSSIYADFSLNLFNSQALLWAKSRGAKAAAVSPELTLQQLGHFKKYIPIEVIAQGSLPLMISEHCVVGSACKGLTAETKCKDACQGRGYALKDRMGLWFPLFTDRFCRTHVYNPMEICLVEDLKPLYDSGVSIIRMELRKDKPEYVGKVTRIYRKEIDRLLNNSDNYVPSQGVKDKLVDFAEQGITKGHIYRGVL